jgi:hypothetical protein
MKAPTKVASAGRYTILVFSWGFGETIGEEQPSFAKKAAPKSKLFRMES